MVHNKKVRFTKKHRFPTPSLKISYGPTKIPRHKHNMQNYIYNKTCTETNTHVSPQNEPRVHAETLIYYQVPTFVHFVWLYKMVMIVEYKYTSESARSDCLKCVG